MTVLASTSRARAVWATRSDRAEDLARIQETGIAAAIWHRTRDPGFAAWIDALPPDQLPRLRALVAVPAVESAVQAACDTAGLSPSPWRDMLAGDCAALAVLFGEIMATPLVQFRLDVIQTDACKRFHLDRVPARLLCTYRGRGTEFGPAAPEGGVTRITALTPGEAAIFRGSLWQHEDCGLLHRSPPITGTGETRLLLVIDLPEEDEDCDCGQYRDRRKRHSPHGMTGVVLKATLADFPIASLHRRRFDSRSISTGSPCRRSQQLCIDRNHYISTGCAN